MQIVAVELTRVRIPFRATFRHAASVRACSDAIIVELVSDSGLRGFGEIQARPYVTGESNDQIWSSAAADLAKDLIGKPFDCFDDIASTLGGPESYTRRPALVGGFDIAMTNLLEHAGLFKWSDVFGATATKPAVKTVTIGDDVDGADLVTQARFARLRGCSVFKLKVGHADDAARVQQLREAIGRDCTLRLDANGQLTRQDAQVLLERTCDLGVHSLEEPFDKGSESLINDLRELHESTGVALMADESICTVADMQRFAGIGAYQLFNARVGKCGGVSGTAAVLAAAKQQQLGLVAGTMVGESAVLLRVSRALLRHNGAIAYVEGLDQTSELLESEAIVERQGSGSPSFEWLVSVHDKRITGRINVK